MSGIWISLRERQLLTGYADGLSNKQIARILGVSVSTVKNEARSAYGKLSARSKTEAVLQALRLGVPLDADLLAAPARGRLAWGLTVGKRRPPPWASIEDAARAE